MGKRNLKITKRQFLWCRWCD